jgi:hypothetical protein
MYSRIPDEIKPTEASSKITYANAFDAKFSLLLRERRSTTLISMQEATIEIDSNILESNRLKTISEKDKKKQREESSSSSNPTTSDPKLDEMTKLCKSIVSSQPSKQRKRQKTIGRPPAHVFEMFLRH